MLKLFAICIPLLFPALLRAEPPAPPETVPYTEQETSTIPFRTEAKNSDSPFHRLSAMFDSAAVPGTNELPGWHTGRLFRAKEPDVPVSVLLAAQWQKPSPASNKKVLLVRRLEDETPVYFDSLTALKRKQIQAELAQRTGLPRTYSGDNCLYVLNAGPENGDKMFIRQHGPYLVFKGFDAVTRQEYYGYVSKKSR
ncbi:MAG: hypothetical protein GX410_01000 [Elusimicrobia bacterium]|nr:hypothetical protein [Elusimicrobiota bacterium]